MIKDFQGWLNESFRDTDTVNITSEETSPIRIILENDQDKDVKGYLANALYSKRFGGVYGGEPWFFLHKGININKEPSEREVVLTLKAAFDTWTTFYATNASKDILVQGSDTMKVLLDHPTFSIWWKKSLDKYKGTLLGKKYGL